MTNVWNEKKFVLIVVLVVIVLVSLPYLFAYFNTPEDSTYPGGHILNVADRYVYYSYLEQTRMGHWLFKDLYTTEAQPRTFFHPFWLALGSIAKTFHLSNALIFHLARILLIPVFLILAWLFISYCFKNKLKRKICFLFLVFSSGLGGLLAVWLKKYGYENLGYAHWPLDLWVPEANTFLTLYHAPNLIASLTLILATLFLIFLAFEKNKLKYSLGAGACALALLFIHPYHIPTIFVIPFVYLLIICLKQKRILFSCIKHFLVLLLCSLPAFLYYLWFFRSNLVAALKMVQNIGLTPAPHLVLIGYGLLVLFALLGIWVIFRKKIINNFLLFIIVWLIIQSLLIYCPFLKFQRRLTEGLHIPLVILTTIGLFYLCQCLKKKISPRLFKLWLGNKMLLIILFVFFFCLSNIYILVQDFVYFAKLTPSLYIPQKKIEVMQWIKKEVPEDNTFLASFINGNILPGLTARRVYVGHWPETICAVDKYRLVKRFFQGNKNDQWKYKFLKEKHIDYIFYSTEEKKLGEFKPEAKDYLDKIYENELVSIYKVE